MACAQKGALPMNRRRPTADFTDLLTADFADGRGSEFWLRPRFMVPRRVHRTWLLPMNRGWANRGFRRWINRGFRGWARIRVLASSVVHGPKAGSSDKVARHEPSPSPCPLPLGEGARRAGEGEPSRCTVPGPKACSSNLAPSHEPRMGQPRISPMD